MALNRATPIPLYYQLLEEIRGKILKPMNGGDMIPSERELCERFRVSRITVRKALDTLTAEGELYRLHGKGTFKSQTADRSIRELTYVIYDIGMAGSPGRERTIQAMAKVAEERGYHFVIRGFNASAGSAGFRDFAFRDGNGGYLISVQELTAEDIAEIRRRRLPCVFMNQEIGYSVRTSLKKAGNMCGEWLQRHSAADIVLMTPPLNLPDHCDFRNGFRSVSTVGEEHLRLLELPYDRKVAEDAFRSLWESGFRPDAVVCGDDLLAAGVADFLNRKNLRGQVLLCGVNNSYLAVEHGFSSVDLCCGKRGRAAAELLADIMEGKAPPPPYAISIEPEFIERIQNED